MVGNEHVWIKSSCLMIVVVISLLVSDGQNAQALPGEVHALISYEAGQLEGIPEEIRQNLGPQDPVPFQPAPENICQGSVDEDWDRDPRLDPWEKDKWIGLFNWGTHFWDPTAGPNEPCGKLIYVTVPVVGTMRVNRGLHPSETCAGHLNAYEWGNWLFNKAVRNYNSESPAYSYYLLGKVAHLLQDMSTPAHVHLDVHGVLGNGDDSYETYMYKYNCFAYGDIVFEQFYGDFVEPYDLVPIDPADLDDGGHPERDDLYRLFWNMAILAGEYDSDDANGTYTQGSMRFCNGSENDISDADCALIADALIPLGIAYTAGLYELFWSKTHPADAPPEITEFTLTPSPVIQDQPLTLKAEGVSDEESSALVVDFYRDTNFNGILDLGIDEYLGYGVPDQEEATLEQFVYWPVGTHRLFAQAIDDQGNINTISMANIDVISMYEEDQLDACRDPGDMSPDQVCGIGLPPLICVSVVGFLLMRCVPLQGYRRFSRRPNG